MEELRIDERPELRQPILIAAFSGWNDAGESATSAVRFMFRRWRAPTVAEIEAETFYDFTQARPRVRLDKGERVLDWPPNKFSAHKLEGQEFDIVLLQATEPHLKWHSYLDAILTCCREFNISTVITLGALLAEVSHTRPIQVNGSSTDPTLHEQFDFAPPASPGYQGPTGIVGALTQAAQSAGLRTASLWANVPVYLDASPNPKGSLALLEVLNEALKLDLRLHDLEVFCARFDAQIAGAVERDPQMAEYARRIEAELPDEDDESASDEPGESDLPDGPSMVEDLERFLREQRDDS
ncbi:MAG TPA: PAC2 family protein [Dehalococcoidia bacterium]|nr:PAC2 family protein [Dehalococcoidia bacterium]